MMRTGQRLSIALRRYPCPAVKCTCEIRMLGIAQPERDLGDREFWPCAKFKRGLTHPAFVEHLLIGAALVSQLTPHGAARHADLAGDAFLINGQRIEIAKHQLRQPLGDRRRAAPCSGSAISRNCAGKRIWLVSAPKMQGACTTLAISPRISNCSASKLNSTLSHAPLVPRRKIWPTIPSENIASWWRGQMSGSRMR